MNPRRTQQPFIILKYKITALGVQSFAYEQVYTPETNSRFISREKAQFLIDKYNMKKVHEGIWELDGNPFYKKFKGYYSCN